MTNRKKTTDLNKYHQEQNQTLLKKRSEQPLMPSEKFIAQVKRLKEQSQSRDKKSDLLYRGV